MKKMLSVAALALLSTAGVAHADDINWSGQTPGLFGSTINYSGGLGHLAYNVAAHGTIFSQPITSGYDQQGWNDGNIQAASPTVTNTWLIKGHVTPDCSYYGGASTNHTLDFGQIGVNTQSTTTVNNAFDMVSSAHAIVNSTTAGCNFNNTVTLTKTNGNQGLLNTAAGGYDSNEFQANIPYTATATFRATTNQSGPQATTGTTTVSAGDSQPSKSGSFGAWRSDMVLDILASTPNKALVAGNYEDTLTVELKAI